MVRGFVISGAVRIVSCTLSMLLVLPAESFSGKNFKQVFKDSYFMFWRYLMKTYRKTFGLIVIAAACFAGCARNDAAEQAMKDAEKLQKQGQEIAAEAAKQAQQSLAEAGKIMNQGTEDARAQMGQLKDPQAQEKINEASAQIDDAKAKANQALGEANAQLEQMKKQPNPAGK